MQFMHLMYGRSKVVFSIAKFNIIYDVLSGSEGQKENYERHHVHNTYYRDWKPPQFILVLRQLQHAEQINHGSQGYHSFGWYFLTKYNSGDQIKEHKMGMACGMCGENRNAYRSLVGTRRKETTHTQDLGLDGTIILKLILKKWDGRVCPGYKSSG